MFVSLFAAVPFTANAAADVTGKGTVDATDATFLQRYLVSLDVPYRINEHISESIEAQQVEYELHVI